MAALIPAFGAWLLYRAASRDELVTLGMAQVMGGALQLAGLLIVDSEVRRVDWSLAGTLAWSGLCLALLLSGLWLVWQARRM